jgi:hypothetical protein
MLLKQNVEERETEGEANNIVVSLSPILSLTGREN